MPLPNQVIVENEWQYRKQAVRVKDRLKAAGYDVPKYRRELFELIGGIVGWSRDQVHRAPIDALSACEKVLKERDKAKGKGDVTPCRLVEPLKTGQLDATRHWGHVMARLEGTPRPMSIEGNYRP